MGMKRQFKWIGPILLSAILWNISIPNGVTVQAWSLFSIFMGTILAFILQPLQIGAIAFISLGLTALLGVLSVKDILSSFSQPTVWLIVSAFLFSRGFIKTGLGKRVAYYLMKCFGDNTLKLAYVLQLSDLLIAPATPSNTARAGGIIYPVVRSVCSAFDSNPGETSKRLGNYLMQASYHGNTTTSAMFMTAMAGNPLMVSIAKDVANIEISWGLWLLVTIVPGIIGFFLIPLIIYFMNPPEIKKTPHAKSLAISELENLGPIKKSEISLVIIFLCALILWATTQITGLNATLIGLLAVGAMIITNVISWNDVTGEKGAWDTMFCMPISQELTHYAAGPSPIFFESGYISQSQWWRNGFILSIINLIIWIGIGSLWIKFLGLI
ncbi:DASS family sodium-coupled anion symporter [Veillonella ratti]|uniref:DASS family sodium-coupled anion symporter n=1 Tax=Veillonella ratti TaxID=103892 RepID=UPI001F4956FC|nr:DASS family sodium-coupled anion symporter [Veillonella ratti]